METHPAPATPPDLRPLGCYFAIMMEGRTGSSYLMSILNERGDSLCYGEPFHGVSAADQSRILDALDRGHYVGDLTTHATLWTGHARQPGSRFHAVGFKSKLIDIPDPDAFRARLEANAYRLIHLYRRNPIKAVVSVHNGMRHGRWNLTASDTRLDESFRIEPQVFRDWFWHRVLTDWALQDFTRCYSGPKLSLAYEELVADPQGVLQQVYDFLGLEPKAAHPRTVKMTNDDLSAVITNLDELRALFPENDPGLRYFRQFFD